MKRKLILAITILITCIWLPCLHAQVLPQDSLALVAFYNSTGGPNWTNHTGWLTGPVSSWYGVTIVGVRVTELKFYTNNNLIGFIPEQIGNLANLFKLIIGYNPKLTGVLPDEIGQLTNLYGLGIGNCSLSGAIPNSIGNCSHLNFINLPQNNFSGALPFEIGNLDSLQFLDLHNNQLSGPIPSEIGNCTELLELRLNNNQLSGTIPTSLANCNQIHTLYLSNNNLIGEIPDELSGVGSYVSLDFSNNHFTGIPPWTPVWLMLNDLAIGGNCLTFEDLEPHFVGYMWYDYYPQDNMQTIIDTLLPKGSDFNIFSGTLGEYTTYYWYHNGLQIPGTENDDTLKLTNISEADAGVYGCEAYSSICKQPNGMPMVLFRRPVTIGITVGVDDQPSYNTLKAYPSPCTNLLHIETSKPIYNSAMIITNIYGIQITQIQWVNGALSTTLNTGKLPNGIYVLTLQDKNQILTQKIVIH